MAQDKDKSDSSNDNPRRRLTPAERRSRRRRRWLIAIVVLAALGAAVMGLHFWQKPFYVREAGWVSTLNKAEIRPLDQGPIEQILVKDNDRVAKGQLLVKLSNRVQEANLELARANLDRCERALVERNGSVELTGSVQWPAIARARAELEHYQATLALRRLAIERTKIENAEAARRAKAELDAAKASFERMKSLDEKELAGARELENVKLDLELKESLYEVKKNTREAELNAELVALEKQIELVKCSVDSAKASYNAELVEARHRLEQARAAYKIALAMSDAREVRSPLEGFIRLHDVVVGESVGNGTRLGEVFDDSAYLVKAKVKERYLDRVEVGQQARIRLVGREGTFWGRVKALPRAITPQTTGEGYFVATIELEPTDVELGPGLQAFISIEAGTISGLQWLLGQD